jgi:hypothetical protein
MTDLTTYTGLITSEHADKPKFMAAVTASVKPLAEVAEMLTLLPLLYDLDHAVGVQLDAVGVRVGRSRYLDTPMVGVYFAFDTAGVGFDEGTWLGPYDPVSGLTSLPDDTYRTLLRAKVLANCWDGTIPGAYLAWDTVFGGTGYQVLIQDNCDMSMVLGLLGARPDAVTRALFTGGYLSLKPAGVRISYYVLPTVDSAPFFGLDAHSDGISGFDVGGFSELITPV